MTIAFTITGAPRTKGNSGVIAKRRNGARFLLPSPKWRHWYKAASAQAIVIKHPIRKLLPIAAPVTVTAVFYRDRAVGDEDNFKKALGDFLQGTGFVVNDRLIHWSGDTRLDKDAAKPRVEVRLEVAA